MKIESVTSTGDIVKRLQAIHEREFPHRPKGVMRLGDDTLVACLYFEERLAEVRAELLARPASLKQADVDRILRTSLHDPE